MAALAVTGGAALTVSGLQFASAGPPSPKSKAEAAGEGVAPACAQARELSVDEARERIARQSKLVETVRAMRRSLRLDVGTGNRVDAQSHVREASRGLSGNAEAQNFRDTMEVSAVRGPAAPSYAYGTTDSDGLWYHNGLRFGGKVDHSYGSRKWGAVHAYGTSPYSHGMANMAKTSGQSSRAA